MNFFQPVWHELPHWAASVGCNVLELRSATRALIRNHHPAAILRERAFDDYPEIYELGLGPLTVFYTVGPKQITVRGYAPNLPDYQTPEEMSGGFYG